MRSHWKIWSVDIQGRKQFFSLIHPSKWPNLAPLAQFEPQAPRFQFIAMTIASPPSRLFWTGKMNWHWAVC